MQVVTICGRVGRDAELRTTQRGDAVCGFTVAVDVRSGSEKAVSWWRVSLWGKRGEALAQYLTKGASVTVQGEFSLGEYDGKPQLNIRANEIALQGGRNEGGQRSTDGSRGAPLDQVRDAFPHAEQLDDDIPFISNMSVW